MDLLQYKIATSCQMCRTEARRQKGSLSAEVVNDGVEWEQILRLGTWMQLTAEKNWRQFFRGIVSASLHRQQQLLWTFKYSSDHFCFQGCGSARLWCVVCLTNAIRVKSLSKTSLNMQVRGQQHVSPSSNMSASYVELSHISPQWILL